MSLLETKEIIITDNKGIERKYILSQFPAIQGREIMFKYALSNIPKLGDYSVSEETMLKLMSFVGVMVGAAKDKPGMLLKLDNQIVLNQHVPNWGVLTKLELAMLEYNDHVFQTGRIYDFLKKFALKDLPKILGALTVLLAQSSQTEKQPSTN